MKTSAHSIALGCSLGIFIGFMPIIPFQAITVITLAFVFRANKIAAFTCTFISNVANVVPFYTMLYMVGSLFMPFESVRFDPGLMAEFDIRVMLDQSWRLLVVMMLGGVIMGVPSSIAMYFISLKIILTYRRRRAMRLLRRRQGG